MGQGSRTRAVWRAAAAAVERAWDAHRRPARLSAAARANPPAPPVCERLERRDLFTGSPASLSYSWVDGAEGGPAATLYASYVDADAGQGHTASISWGDGTTSTITPSSVNSTSGYLTATHVYGDDGWKTATVRMVDSGAETATATAYPSITNVAPSPSAYFIGSSAANEGQTMSLSLSAYDPGNDTISRYIVDWGDSQTLTYAFSSGTAAHAYDRDTWPVPTSPHYFYVRVYPVDEDGTHGLSGSAATAVAAVHNVTPTLAIGGDYAAYEGTPFQFYFSAENEPTNDTISRWTLNWGDGTINTYTAGTAGATVSHTYADGPNAYTLSLSTNDEDAAYATTRAVTVENVAPSLVIGGDYAAYEAQPFYAYAIAYGDPGQDTVTWIALANGITEAGEGDADVYGTFYYYSLPYTPSTLTLTATAYDEDTSYTTTAEVAGYDTPPSVSMGGSPHVETAADYTLPYQMSEPGDDFSPNFYVDWGDGSTSSYYTADWTDATYPDRGYTGWGAATHAYATEGNYTIGFVVDYGDGPHGPTTKTVDVGPNAPTGLTAAALSVSQVNLVWTDNSSVETGYEIQRATDSGFTADVVTQTAPARAGAGAAGFTDVTASPSTTYYYRVRATNTAGPSAYSASASVTTPAAGTGSTPSDPHPTAPAGLPTTAPAAPSGLSASAGTDSIALSWSAVSGASYYNVYRSVAGSGMIGDTIVGAPYAAGVASAAYTDNYVIGGPEYTYTVTAVVGDLESSQSSAAADTVSPNATPTGLRLETTRVLTTIYNNDGHEVLAWDSMPGVSSYYVKQVPIYTNGSTYTTGSPVEETAAHAFIKFDPPSSSGAPSGYWLDGWKYAVAAYGTDYSDYVIRPYVTASLDAHIDAANVAAGEPDPDDYDYDNILEDGPSYDRPDGPGKVIVVNNGFKPASRTPGFADFDGGTEAARFVPVVLERIAFGFDSDDRIVFEYDGSDPAEVTGNDTNGYAPAPGLPPVQEAPPAPGTLRLWTKDGTDVRNEEAKTSGGGRGLPRPRRSGFVQRNGLARPGRTHLGRGRGDSHLQDHDLRRSRPGQPGDCRPAGRRQGVP